MNGSSLAESNGVSMMKIAFIRPNMGSIKAADSLQPLGIAALDGLTPEGTGTVFYDDRIEAVPMDIEADAVVLSVETFTARRAYQLSERFRKRGISVIMGGYHPTFLPEEALQYADAVVMGEAEGIWGQVMEDLEKGSLERIYRNAGTCSLNDLRFERRLFKDKRYAPIYPVQFSRGCRFSCDFCSISAFYGRELRQRPVQDVAKEIARLGQKHLFLVDDNFYVDKEKTKALLKALIPLKVRWSTQASVDIANDPELLQLMRRSGCMAVLMGFESLDHRNLAQMGKGINLKNSRYSEAIRRIRAQGIMVYGTFVFGYDFDTRDSFEPCLEFALENKLMLANFNPLMPMPGTRLYDRLQAEGRLIHDRWWLSPDFRYGDAMFHPNGMKAEELTEGCRNARYAFNTYSSIATRALDFRANAGNPVNLAMYALSNLISRKEIYNKQGAALGDFSEKEAGL